MKKKTKKKEPEHIISTDYLGKIYRVNDYVRLIPKMVAAIKKLQKRRKFDAIAFTGTSGAALAYPLSLKLKLPLICVRKNDDNHFGYPIEGCVTAEKYIIIDDFIADGDTMNRIMRAVKRKMPQAKPVAIFLYTSTPLHKKWKDVPIIYPDAINRNRCTCASCKKIYK